MQGSSDAKTVEALQDVAAQASAFAPCMLLLNHIDALVDDRGERACRWRAGGGGYGWPDICGGAERQDALVDDRGERASAVSGGVAVAGTA